MFSQMNQPSKVAKVGTLIQKPPDMQMLYQSFSVNILPDTIHRHVGGSVEPQRLQMVETILSQNSKPS